MDEKNVIIQEMTDMPLQLNSYYLDQEESLTFNSEVHGLADVSPHIIADLAEVVSTIFFQYMLDQQGAICEKLDAPIQGNWLELGNSSTYWESSRWIK